MAQKQWSTWRIRRIGGIEAGRCGRRGRAVRRRTNEGSLLSYVSLDATIYMDTLIQDSYADGADGLGGVHTSVRFAFPHSCFLRGICKHLNLASPSL